MRKRGTALGAALVLDCRTAQNCSAGLASVSGGAAFGGRIA
jgi:hypothetical protein